MVSLDIEVEGGCSSNCEHKIELEKLKKVLSPDDLKIPDDLWKIFSLKGEYIKNILLYSGYETIDSIMNLKNDCELTEAISFVNDMCIKIEGTDICPGSKWNQTSKSHSFHMIN